MDTITRLRDLVHEANRRGESSELAVVALELAEEYEKLAASVERMNAALEEIKGMI